MIRICMVGTGYVGLVSGACMADFGHEVWCVDILEDRIAGLRQGIIPFHEPGLENLVLKNQRAGRLHFTTSLTEGVAAADIVFIAVQTPMSENGEADLSHVMQVGREIGALLRRDKIIVTKSTVPVGTARKLAAVIKDSLREPLAFEMVSNPEFLREGSSIEDFMRPDRVIIGVESERAQKVMREIYRPLYLLDTPLLICDIETAELIKYAANSFLAVKISFINEMAALAERVGADVAVIAKAMGMDRRIGPKFLHAGLGFGGSCLPKDTSAIVRIAHDAGARMRLVEAAIDVNSELPARALVKARRLVGDLAGKSVALFGLAFKPNTDDIRSAASLALVRGLLAAGATVQAHDPVAVPHFQAVFPDLTYCESPYEAATGADLCVLVTEWNEYRQLDFERLARIVASRAFLDCRNVYDHVHLAHHGFRYDCFGRPAGPPSGGVS
jgi:UDPglucose 6-dehydrogenase